MFQIIKLQDYGILVLLSEKAMFFISMMTNSSLVVVMISIM